MFEEADLLKTFKIEYEVCVPETLNGNINTYQFQRYHTSDSCSRILVQYNNVCCTYILITSVSKSTIKYTPVFG